MKTILKRLRFSLPVLAILFFCSQGMAQSLSELTTMQSELQAYIASANARISDPNVTATLTQQELNAFQAEINGAQGKLAAVNDMIAIAQQDVIIQQEIANESTLLAAKNAAIAQQQADEVARQQLIAQRQAAQEALDAQIAAKQAAIANPARYTPAPDPNHPTWVPFRVSTGNAEQDAQIVRDWLQQHGIVR
jgi:hypothetical protein